MSTLQEEFQSLFNRDLNRLIDNLRETPPEMLWKVPEGVNNSCGVLIQHLVGNLNYFIGKGFGEIDYIRQRKKEFSNTQSSKEELEEDILELKKRLDSILIDLEDDQLNGEIPLEVSFDTSARGFLVHLYGHLNYHLGQVNYLRRLLTGS